MLPLTARQYSHRYSVSVERGAVGREHMREPARVDTTVDKHFAVESAIAVAAGTLSVDIHRHSPVAAVDCKGPGVGIGPEAAIAGMPEGMADTPELEAVEGNHKLNEDIEHHNARHSCKFPPSFPRL